MRFVLLSQERKMNKHSELTSLIHLLLILLTVSTNTAVAFQSSLPCATKGLIPLDPQQRFMNGRRAFPPVNAVFDGIMVTTLRVLLGLIIGGGTAQIQKNIIAERGLGMPREPKAAGA